MNLFTPDLSLLKSFQKLATCSVCSGHVESDRQVYIHYSGINQDINRILDGLFQSKKTKQNMDEKGAKQNGVSKAKCQKHGNPYSCRCKKQLKTLAEWGSWRILAEDHKGPMWGNHDLPTMDGYKTQLVTPLRRAKRPIFFARLLLEQIFFLKGVCHWSLTLNQQYKIWPKKTKTNLLQE